MQALVPMLTHAPPSARPHARLHICHHACPPACAPSLPHFRPHTRPPDPPTHTHTTLSLLESSPFGPLRPLAHVPTHSHTLSLLDSSDEALSISATSDTRHARCRRSTPPMRAGRPRSRTSRPATADASVAASSAAAAARTHAGSSPPCSMCARTRSVRADVTATASLFALDAAAVIGSRVTLFALVGGTAIDSRASIAELSAARHGVAVRTRVGGLACGVRGNSAGQRVERKVAEHHRKTGLGARMQGEVEMGGSEE
eukprot:356016-Chlamydomonas_euryale.AAC.3